MRSRPLEKFALEGLPEGWRQMRIGEAVEEASSPVEMRDDEEYLLASIRRRFGGMFHRERLHGREILTKNLQRVVPGRFVIARMQIVHGACALADEQFENHVISKSYSSFKSTEHCDTRFFSKLAEQPFMTEYFRDASHGVVIEKMTFQQDRWLEFPIWLPPLEEQRRIVEILDMIDETVQATDRVITKRREILEGLQTSLLKAHDGANWVAVGDLVSHHWPGEWGEQAPSDGFQEVTVLRATNLNDYGVDYSTGARRFVTRSKIADKRLIDGDLIVEAAGGGPGVPVGRVRRFRQPAGNTPYLTSNFFRTLRPKAGVDPDYLFWLLDNEYRKPAIWSCQQQTTGIINLKVRDYLERPVSCHHGSQVAIARALNGALGAVEAERRLLQKLRETRTGLAVDLLSGRVRTVAA